MNKGDNNNMDNYKNEGDNNNMDNYKNKEKDSENKVSKK